jgi:hypothetical protein
MAFATQTNRLLRGAGRPGVARPSRRSLACFAKTHKVCVLPGDGIGPEIMTAALKVLTTAGKKEGQEFVYDYALIGGAAIDATGKPLPDETLAKAKASDAVLLAAIGGRARPPRRGKKAAPPPAARCSRGRAARAAPIGRRRGPARCRDGWRTAQRPPIPCVSGRAAAGGAALCPPSAPAPRFCQRPALFLALSLTAPPPACLLLLPASAATSGTRCRRSSARSAGCWACARGSTRLPTCGPPLCRRSWPTRRP